MSEGRQVMRGGGGRETSHESVGGRETCHESGGEWETSYEGWW